jgi:ABC-type nitrate/sulfonate/bicarbonate transport system substrate-binding protein
MKLSIRTRISLTGLVIAAAAVLVVIVLRSPTSDPTTGLKTVTMRFPLPEVRAPYGVWYAADHQGFYRDMGLKVGFNYGGKATNPVAMVVSRTDQFGVLGGPDTALVAVGKGAPLKILAIIHKASNFPCLITLKKSGITTVKELEGKKVGMYSGHISIDVLRNLFRRAHVTVREIDVGFDYSQLISGSIDAQWAFTAAAAVELPEKGVEVNVISPADYGIITHGYTIFARDDYIAEHPDEVRGYLAATFKGVTYMAEHPEEVAQLVTARDNTGNLVEWQVLRRVRQYNEVTPHDNPLPPGYFDKKMLQETYDRLLEEGVIEKPFDLDTAYTTKFLKEIHGNRYAASGGQVTPGKSPLEAWADGR